MLGPAVLAFFKYVFFGPPDDERMKTAAGMDTGDDDEEDNDDSVDEDDDITDEDTSSGTMTVSGDESLDTIPIPPDLAFFKYDFFGPILPAVGATGDDTGAVDCSTSAPTGDDSDTN